MEKNTIASYAYQLRDELKIGKDEIVGDIVGVAKKAGYHYVQERFGNEFSGFSRYLGGPEYMIGFNSDQNWSPAFHRFTVSHEFGHVSIPVHRNMLESGNMHRSMSEFRSRNQIEREADYFAVCFLAPATYFKKAMHPYDCTKKAIYKLAGQFGVSPYASVLRFMELTDLACTLIVSNKDGQIEYERCSDRMKEQYRHDFLKAQPLIPSTLTFDYVVNGNRDIDECMVKISDWFDDMSGDIEVTESIIELGYNGKFLTLLYPHVGDLESFMAEKDY